MVVEFDVRESNRRVTPNEVLFDVQLTRFRFISRQNLVRIARFEPNVCS